MTTRPPFAYFDTSFLLRRYLNDSGHQVARSVLHRSSVVTSALSPAEGVSALRRRASSREFAETDLTRLVATLRADAVLWHLVAVTSAVVQRAQEIILQTGARTLDAIHLASALEFQNRSGGSVPFATTDERQRVAAVQIGLRVIGV